MFSNLRANELFFTEEFNRIDPTLANRPDGAIITIGEYRKILDDYASSDSQIKQRLQYLEAFCRNVIQDDLEKYVAQTHKKI